MPRGAFLHITGGLGENKLALTTCLREVNPPLFGQSPAILLVTTLIAAGVIWLIDRTFPLSPGSWGYLLDPLYLPAAVAGGIAYLLGRSRRSAFIGGVLAILVLDIAAWGENIFRGIHANNPIILGGAGIFDATLVAGVIAVMLAEVIGEVRERLERGSEEDKG